MVNEVIVRNADPGGALLGATDVLNLHIKFVAGLSNRLMCHAQRRQDKDVARHMLSPSKLHHCVVCDDITPGQIALIRVGNLDAQRFGCSGDTSRQQFFFAEHT